MLNALRNTRNAVALEAFSATDFTGVLHNLIPNMVVQLKALVGQFTPDTPSAALTSQQRDFFKEVQKHSYLDISPLSACVPEGLNTTYLLYGEELQRAVHHVTGIIEQVLGPYSIFLSQLISHPEQKLSTASFDPVYKKLMTEREELNARLGDCFKKGATHARVQLGDVVKRNSEWEEVFILTADLTRDLGKVDRKVLNRKLNECSGLLEIITKKIKRDEFNGISAQAVKNIAEGAYQVASELEFYSVTYYKVTAYVEAINRTIQHFQEVFKK